MSESVRTNYEVSLASAERHWEVPYSRMEDTSPTPTQPAAVKSRTNGTQICGTILSIDAGASIAIVDFTCSMVYAHDVRNVLTYSGAAENTFGALNIGDPVYYDRSSTMPAGVKLSTSPLDKDGNANPLFGYIVAKDDTDSALFAKGGGTASTQTYVGVMQRGAGA
jgi:hypothetical protein